ncbi:MAG: hypothetical protein K2L87_06910, partial [Clostridiales bacterium]|nr:hypothetical protein [Clostridiales bacterium]
ILRSYVEQLNKRAVSGTAAEGLSVGALLARARQFTEAADWKNAGVCYEKVLERDEKCAEAWWGQLHLEFNARNTDELLKDIDWQTAEKIEGSSNFMHALRCADEKFKAEIDAFSSRLHDPARWWNLFLTEMGAADEAEILSGLDKHRLQRVEDSKNFHNADKYADGDFKARIEAFKHALYSAESYWKLFLQDFNAESEEGLLSLLDDGKFRLIESNAYYQKANARAEGELRERIDRFNETVHSGEFWWGVYLRGMGAEHEQQLLDNFDVQRYQALSQNAAYQNAKAFADEAFSERIAAYEKASEERYNAYRKAATAWVKLLNECNCKSDADLNELTYFVDENDLYIEALDWAKKSCVQAVIARFESVGRVQKEEVLHTGIQRKAQSREMRKSGRQKLYLALVFIALYAGLAALMIVFMCRKTDWGFLKAIPGIEKISFRYADLTVLLAFFSVIVGGGLSQILSASRGKSWLTQLFVLLFQIPAYFGVLVLQYFYTRVGVSGITTWAYCAFIALYMLVMLYSQCVGGAKMGRLKLCLPNALVIVFYAATLRFCDLVADGWILAGLAVDFAEIFSAIEIALVCITATWIIFIYGVPAIYTVLSFIFMPVCMFAIIEMALRQSKIWLAILTIIGTLVVLIALSWGATVIRRRRKKSYIDEK